MKQWKCAVFVLLYDSQDLYNKNQRSNLERNSTSCAHCFFFTCVIQVTLVLLLFSAVDDNHDKGTPVFFMI